MLTRKLGLGNLSVGSNSWLTALALDASSYYVLTVTNTPRCGGRRIIYDGLGSALGAGQGAGRTNTVLGFGGGGGYGGYGGASISNSALGGTAYGATPTLYSAGSAGGAGSGTAPYNVGGRGGGILVLVVSNALLLNGSISANGTAGIGQNSGGGSGGGVWLTVDSIRGSGSISANGGAGDLRTAAEEAVAGSLCITPRTSSPAASLLGRRGRELRRGGDYLLAEQTKTRDAAAHPAND